MKKQSYGLVGDIHGQAPYKRTGQSKLNKTMAFNLSKLALKLRKFIV